MGQISASIKIGALDRKITFRQSTETQSDSGSVNETWSDVATVRANVKSRASSEKFEVEREMTFNRKLFTIRYRSDLNEKMIIIYETKEYDIKSINELDGTRKRFLVIQAEKRE